MEQNDRVLREIAGGYSVQSGVFGALNPNISTRLNARGQYEAEIDSIALTAQELDDLTSVSAMANDQTDESDIAAALFAQSPGVSHRELVGYYQGLYAGHVLDETLRASASSGGIATWLLTELLSRGLVDGVIHVQPSQDADGPLFQYGISTTREEVIAGAKSRYYPADLSEVLRTAKAAGGRYAITGIPSFITELRLLAAKDAEFGRAIAFTVGLICGHQKSTRYADAIAWEHGIKPGTLTGIDFRKKVPGKVADEYITEMRYLEEGVEKVVSKEANEVFVSSWSHGFFKSKFSDFTDDLLNETADIALGDAWLPQYTGDHRGTSLVIVRNADIASIIQEGMQTGQLHLDALSPEDVVRSQSGLVRHANRELPYRLFRAEKRNQWHPKKRLAPSGDLSVLRRKIQDIREEIAEQSHVHFERAVELDSWQYFVDKMKPLVDQHNALYSLSDAARLMRRGPRHFMSRAIREVSRRFSKEKR